MSASKPPHPSGDPSMDDILASIRRILNEDEGAPPPPPPNPAGGGEEDVLVLDTAMLVAEPATPASPPADEPTRKIAAETVRQLAAPAGPDQTLRVRRDGGPTLEDLVREALQPLLKEWLDRHMETVLERIVRAEAERLAERTR